MSEADLNTLAKRIQALEDRLAIYDIIASYGPAVDSRSREKTAALFAEDGWYDFGGDILKGAPAIGDLVDSTTHVSYVEKGCAHAIALPKVDVDGDRAVAIGISRVYLHHGDHWRIERASANRWEFSRTADGWQVTGRTNRLLDGSGESRSLLAGRQP